MFSSKTTYTKEEVNTLIQSEIQKIREEFIHCIYALNQKNAELEQTIFNLNNEQKTAMQNHTDDIESKIWSFAKVWNPVMQGNIDKIKVEIENNIDEKMKNAIEEVKNSNDDIQKQFKKNLASNAIQLKKYTEANSDIINDINIKIDNLRITDNIVSIGYTKKNGSIKPIFIISDYKSRCQALGFENDCFMIPYLCDTSISQDIYINIESLSLVNGFKKFDIYYLFSGSSRIYIMKDNIIIRKKEANDFTNGKIHNKEGLVIMKEYLDSIGITLVFNGVPIKMSDIQ